VYDPDECLGRIVSKVGDALPKPKDDSWWYVAAAPPQAFVFLQDVSKPVLMSIGNSKAFVRVGTEAITEEQTWAIEPGNEFASVATPDDEDELIWKHKATGAHLNVLIEQALPAWRIADLFVRQEQISNNLRAMTFWAIKNAGGGTMAKVRNLCPTNWPILQSSTGDLFWAHPRDQESEASEMSDVLERLGIICLRVQEEDRDSILSQLAALPSESGMFTSARHDILTPVRLSQRTFWLSDTMPFTGKLTREHWIGLLELKAGYEASHGYDWMQGKDSMTIAGEEMQRILADPFTVRARRMLDIGFDDDSVLVNVRIIGDVSASGEALAKECLREIDSIKHQVRTLLQVGTLSEA
jgi:hypothetical protein